MSRGYHIISIISITIAIFIITTITISLINTRQEELGFNK